MCCPLGMPWCKQAAGRACRSERHGVNFGSGTHENTTAQRPQPPVTDAQEAQDAPTAISALSSSVPYSAGVPSAFALAI